MRNFFTAILPPMGAGMAVVVLCGALYWWQASQQENTLREREAARVDVLSFLFEQDLKAVIADLRVLADGDGLHDYLESGQQTNLDRAVHRAVFFSQERPDYDQLRFLDERGREVFRVNWNGAVAAPAELQDRSSRPYFQKALPLSAGRIYISAFDLNEENGVLQQPPKPMLRFAMPVFTADGQRRGVYVINYRGANLLDRMQRLLPQQQGTRLRVLNAQGYWLKTAQPGNEWGFMFPGREGATMAREDPVLWTQIARQPVGQPRMAGRMFTWRRFVLSDLAGHGASAAVTGDDFLVFASEVTGADWATVFAPLRRAFITAASALLLLAALGLWFWQDRQRAVRELDRFFTLTPDMLCLADFNGRFKRLNPAWERTLGFTKQELMAKPFMEFVHPDDRLRTTQEYERQSKGKEAICFENRYLRADGTYCWLMWNARPVAREGIIVASARDVTARKAAELERDQFFALSGDLMCIVGFDARFKRVNPAVERTLGYSAEELLDKPVTEFVHPEDRATSMERVRNLAQNGEAGFFQNRYLHKDGTVRWLSWGVAPSPEVKRIFCVARDSTSAKEAEDSVRKLNEELKFRAIQLEAANKEMEAFSYSVSHDLRAPLRHIDGFVDLLEKHGAAQLDGKGRRYLEIIAGSARQMGDLIDDLLAFSRMNRAELRRARIALAPMVAATIDGMQIDLQKRKVEWTIGQLPEVEADASMLRLVWANLIGNAVKYTRKQETAKIEIGCTRGTETEHVIFIRDNGVGFDMKYEEKLFGVFQRLHSSDEFEGTGIGLANVRRIITRHGGRTWAEAKVDAGAMFYFSLPKHP